MQILSKISSVNEYIELIEQIAFKDTTVIFEEKLRLYVSMLNQNRKSTNGDASDHFKISFLSEQIKMLENSIETFDENNKNTFVCFYRGQSNINYKLLPSIMRNGQLKKEDYLYHMMRVQCANDFRGATHLEQLVKMQHYDCPTRLLDVTSNPLVALYFACKDGSDQAEGCVYIFYVAQQDMLFYDSDRAKVLSALASFNAKEKKQLYDACILKLKSGGKFNASKNAKIVERLYKQIRSEDASFEKNIDPLDVLSAFFVQPIKDNNRIIKQDGAFIIDGLSLNEIDCDDKLSLLAYGKIPIVNQEKILKQLDALGISEATLFPEIDKVAHYYKEK